MTGTRRMGYQRNGRKWQVMAGPRVHWRMGLSAVTIDVDGLGRPSSKRPKVAENGRPMGDVKSMLALGCERKVGGCWPPFFDRKNGLNGARGVSTKQVAAEDEGRGKPAKTPSTRRSLNSCTKQSSMCLTIGVNLFAVGASEESAARKPAVHHKSLRYLPPR